LNEKEGLAKIQSISKITEKKKLQQLEKHAP